MIVISGALVLVALVLLIIGLVSTALGFVYASIAVSVVSFAFLLIGIVQRRGEQLPEPAAAGPLPATSGGSDVEGVTAIIPAASRPRPAGQGAVAVDKDPVSGTVLVVAGRPRYHVEGCRYLTGKDADEVSVDAARADGFSACGVCKPDEALAAAAGPAVTHVPAAEPAAEPAAASAPGSESTVSLEKAGAPDPVRAARKTTAKAPARKAAATRAAAAVPAKKAPAAVPAKKAPAAKQAAPAKAPAKKAVAKAPAKKAVAKAPARKAAAKAPAKKATGR